jgi:hypothetical protein
VQSAHSLAEFAHQYPNHFSDWMQNSQYLVSLSTDDEQSLKDLYDKLKFYGAHVVSFTEPDIDNQWTAICYYGTPELMKITQKLELALNNYDYERRQMVNV